MSNSLESVQTRHFVGPDLGPNCLQRLSADDTSRQRVQVGMVIGKVSYHWGRASAKKKMHLKMSSAANNCLALLTN